MNLRSCHFHTSIAPMCFRGPNLFLAEPNLAIPLSRTKLATQEIQQPLTFPSSIHFDRFHPLYGWLFVWATPPVCSIKKNNLSQICSENSPSFAGHAGRNLWDRTFPGWGIIFKIHRRHFRSSSTCSWVFSNSWSWSSTWACLLDTPGQFYGAVRLQLGIWALGISEERWYVMFSNHWVWCVYLRITTTI